MGCVGVDNRSRHVHKPVLANNRLRILFSKGSLHAANTVATNPYHSPKLTVLQTEPPLTDHIQEPQLPKANTSSY